MMQVLWKPIWMFLKKLKIELPYNPAIPLLGGIESRVEKSIEGYQCLEEIFVHSCSQQHYSQ